MQDDPLGGRRVVLTLSAEEETRSVGAYVPRTRSYFCTCSGFPQPQRILVRWVRLLINAAERRLLVKNDIIARKKFYSSENYFSV